MLNYREVDFLQFTPVARWLDEKFCAFVHADDDQYKIGTILHTKDGRHFGNATIVDIKESFYIILTDIGNIVKLNESEICTLFHTPTKRRVYESELPKLMKEWEQR